MENIPHYITQLLIVSVDTHGANRMISDLRQAGISLRPELAGTSAQLSELLGQEPWDVLIYFDDDVVARELLFPLLKQHQQDPLVIEATSSASTPPAIALPQWQLGNVYDIVNVDDVANLRRSLLHASCFAALRHQARQLELRCKDLASRNDQLLVHSTTPICTLQQGIHVYCNPAYAELFGFEDHSALLGKPFINLVAPEDQPRLQQWLMQPDKTLDSTEAHMTCFDNTETPMSLIPTVVEYQGKRSLQLFLQHAAGNTKYRAALEKIQYHDLVTQLYNRSFFMLQLETAIRRAVEEGKFTAILLMQLPDFGKWCEALGRQNANLLLHDVALQLNDLARSPITVSRIEEATFGLLLPHDKTDAALQFAAEVQQVITDRVLHDNTSLPSAKFTTGVALINGYTLDAEEILRRVQIQPLSASGVQLDKDQVEMAGAAEPTAESMLQYLALAIRERRFKLNYQPIVGMQGTAPRSYEVLVRMIDAEGQEVAPAAFLPLAVMNDMGEALDRMIAGMLLESKAGAGNADQLMLNLTSATLDSETFLPWLMEELHKHRFPAERLVLEVSEVDLHRNEAHALKFCEAIQNLGLQLAISHFGCALQPLAMLDKVKPALAVLDVRLVRNLLYSPRLKKYLQKLIGNLHERGLKVVIPQIEDVDVLPLLWDIGADYAQGYCLQPPSTSMNYAFMQEEEITLPRDRH